MKTLIDGPTDIDGTPLCVGDRVERAVEGWGERGMLGTVVKIKSPRSVRVVYDLQDQAGGTFREGTPKSWRKVAAP